MHVIHHCHGWFFCLWMVLHRSDQEISFMSCPLQKRAKPRTETSSKSPAGSPDFAQKAGVPVLGVLVPNTPCMAYIPTLNPQNHPNVGIYSIHGVSGYIYIYICMFSSGNMDAFLGTWTEDPLLQGAKLLTHSLLSE